MHVESVGQAQIDIEGKCESPKGLENAFEYLPMVRLMPMILNAGWLKIEAWAMDWKEHPVAKKTVDRFLAELIRELDHYLGDAPSVTMPSEATQPQSLAPTDAPKTKEWAPEQIAFETYKATVKVLQTNYVLILLGILAIIVAIWVSQSSTQAVVPTATPHFVSPTPTP